MLATTFEPVRYYVLDLFWVITHWRECSAIAGHSCLFVKPVCNWKSQYITNAKVNNPPRVVNLSC